MIHNTLPAKGDHISRPDYGEKVAVVQFVDGHEETTPVESEAQAKAVVMAAFKKYGRKIVGGFCATREG